jgi:uncharacterized protein YcbX
VTEAVGTVRALWRFPVKSMLGEELESAEVGEGGVLGDQNDPQCIMPSLAQEGGVERDPRILGALGAHNRIEVGSLRYPCIGVYAVVERGGTIGKDDRVSPA